MNITYVAENVYDIEFEKVLPHMYLNQGSVLYFWSTSFLIGDKGVFGATIAGVIILCFVLEFVNFGKWYFTTRKRITANSLKSLIQINKSAGEQKQEMKKFHLGPCGRAGVTFLNFISKFLVFLTIVLVMGTYNLAFLLVICFSRTIANLMFGLIQDTIVVKKIKKEKKKREKQQHCELIIIDIKLLHRFPSRDRSSMP